MDSKKKREKLPIFPDGCLVTLKRVSDREDLDGRGGWVKSYADGRYTISLPVYETFKCCGCPLLTGEKENVKVKRKNVVAMGQQKTVILHGLDDIKALNDQTAVVTKYIEDSGGQYECLVLTVVEGHPGGKIVVNSKNLRPFVKQCTCNPLKRKREAALENAVLPDTVEQHEAAWKRFVEEKHEDLRLDEVPWPDNPASAEDRFKLLELHLRNDDLKGTVLRMLRMRWHPDRFMGKFGRCLHPDSFDAVKERVTEISTFVNHDVATVGRWKSKS